MFLFFTIQLFSANYSVAQSEVMRDQLITCFSDKKADIGISIYHFGTHDTLAINGNKYFPMQSVFKLPIALLVLHQVDMGKLNLQNPITITQKDLLPETWSPLREKYPHGTTLPLSEIVEYTVAQSDNNGCDILLRIVGGPDSVENYMHQIGISDIAIRYTEAEQHAEWETQYKNCTTPNVAVLLLRKFLKDSILSSSSFDFLWKVLTQSTTGTSRIKGLLPQYSEVAHKTGSSGINTGGIIAATNDIGIVRLPDGNYFAIAIFVSDSQEDNSTNEKIIAELTKVVWDFYIHRNKP